MMRFVNNLKTTMLLGSLMAICMLIGHFVGGPRGVMIGFALATSLLTIPRRGESVPHFSRGKKLD